MERWGDVEDMILLVRGNALSHCSSVCCNGINNQYQYCHGIGITGAI